MYIVGISIEKYSFQNIGDYKLPIPGAIPLRGYAPGAMLPAIGEKPKINFHRSVQVDVCVR